MERRCIPRFAMPVVILLFLVSSFATGEGKMMRIDTHAHYLPPFYYDLLVTKSDMSGGRGVPKWNVSEHLAVMESLNIELSILSVSLPGARFTPDDVEEGRPLARKLNEYGHMLAVSYPGRFQFFATLTLPDVEGSIAEAIYSLDTLKAAGVLILANSHGEYLGNKMFDPLMEVLNAREATVFIHPGSIDIAPLSTNLEVDEDLPTFVIDFLLDTTRAVANLVHKNVTGRYPNIKFLLAHSGGFLPFAAYRLGGALSMLTKGRPNEIMKQLQDFYADTALASSPSALPSTLTFLPPTQITFGSDYPYAPTLGIHIASSQLDAYPLADEKREKINFGNANNLFDKTLTHWRSIWRNQALGVGQQDLAGSDLAGSNFAGSDFAALDFAGSDFGGALCL